MYIPLFIGLVLVQSVNVDLFYTCSMQNACIPKPSDHAAGEMPGFPFLTCALLFLSPSCTYRFWRLTQTFIDWMFAGESNGRGIKPCFHSIYCR